MSTTDAILIGICVYLVVLVCLAYKARSKKKGSTLREFYLAGGGLSSFVLLFTLYATQYSANTMLVVPAEVVNQGLGMILVMCYMTAIVVCYLLFAPKLYSLSRSRQYITPGDFFQDRFQYSPLTWLANLVFLIVSMNFLLAQLMAMGYIAETVTSGAIPYWAGVVGLSVIVLLYEIIGGMRAVAWTDVIQGGMLLIGLVGIFIIADPSPRHLTEVIESAQQSNPEKVEVPNPSFQWYWASTVLMIGLGGSIYPQAIQRLYAAKSVRILKQSLSWMAVMPLVTVFILFLLGIISMPYYDGVDQVSRDVVLPEMLMRWATESTVALVLVVMVIVGLLAAIMSTADSVLLTMSSIVVKDLMATTRWKDLPEERLTHHGKMISLIIMVLLTLWAMTPKITLWGLIELKMQLLVQLVPIVLLGLYSEIRGRPIMVGVVVGLASALITFFCGYKTIWGLQAGLVALAFNFIAIFTIHYTANE